jgi:hypothetical protein
MCILFGPMRQIGYVMRNIEKASAKQLLQVWHGRSTSSCRAKARYPRLRHDQHRKTLMPGPRPSLGAGLRPV